MVDCQATTTSNDSSARVSWVWQSNPNPWSQSESVEWSPYSDIENLIIEEAYMAKDTHAILDAYSIDFEHKVQISNDDWKTQRPVERRVGKRDVKSLRESRFNFDPIAPKSTVGGQYGWASPFIEEAKKYLKLGERQLPSRDEKSVPMIVEKAALGIIEEGKKIGQKRIGERMAQELLEQKDKGIREVWKCCARLYTMDSFLFKKLNETMRLIGSTEHKHIWRSKIDSLGPFALLLWDDPFDRKPKTGKELLYRGVNLNDAQIATYKECLAHPNDHRSFQAFTSCSRNRTIAEMLGNVLLIMEISCAFTSNLQPHSMMDAEEEELVTPGVGLTVHQVEFDELMNKHLIYLKLQHRFNSELPCSYIRIEHFTLLLRIRCARNIEQSRTNLNE